jgi:hypothetical protein
MAFDSGFVGDGDMDSIGSLLTDPIAKIEQFFGANGQKMPDPTRTANTPAPTASKTMQTAGLLVTVLGGINSAVGSYFAAKSTQYQEKSAALNLGYQADMAAINARSAEYAAQGDLEAGKSQIFNQTLRAGQEKASATASMASRGIALGSGSAADVSASQDIIKDIDMYTINANATRAAAAARTQSTNYANQALMDRTSAVNARMSADTISPFAAMSSSLLTTASSVAQQWNQSQRLKMYGMYPQAGGFN